MQIALISVAPPYRGGISKHTSILVQKLSNKHTVDIINYSRQYPNFLFPGKTQYIEKDSDQELGERLIDSINPITWFTTGKKLAKRNYDLIIFRFWNPFFSPALGLIALQILKNSPHTKLISLCDNILPHEKNYFGNFLTHYFFRKMHGHIVQSGKVEQELRKIISNPIYEKRFHPLYDTFPKKIDKEEAKAKLGITSNNIILYFGLIRPYKGFDILLKAVALLKERISDFHLIAAGECYESREKYVKLINKLRISDFITWYDTYIPDDEVQNYFSAADITALPYRSASQSGITQISYYYDIPVIVTCVGGLPEIVSEGKSGFIIKPDNSEALADVLYKGLTTSGFKNMSDYIRDYKRKFSWDEFINGIEEVYQKL